MVVYKHLNDLLGSHVLFRLAHPTHLSACRCIAVQVRKMKMISPTNREVDIGQTLKPDEYIGMTRREVSFHTHRAAHPYS